MNPPEPEPLVGYQVADGRATVTLDSPANRNALSTRMRHDLDAAIRRALADPAARSIVLTHTGPVFCAGMDLKESPAAGTAELATILQLIWSAEKPVIARLSGTARAGGLGLLAACDLAAAVDTATFAFSEVRIGVVPAMIATVILPRMQPRAAAELMLTGEPFTATRAAEIGLITRTCALEDLDTVVDHWTDALRSAGPNALAGTKSLLNQNIDQALTTAAAESARYFSSDEAAEGMAAFREKRCAHWTT